MNFYTVMGATTSFVSSFYSKVMLFRNIAKVHRPTTRLTGIVADTLHIDMKNGDVYELKFILKPFKTKEDGSN